MSERIARVVLAVVVGTLVLGALAVDLPALCGGRFWSDGATYYAMARSLAEDGDLQYESKDVRRVRQEFPSGPDGIFLKRASGGITFDPVSGVPWLRRVRADAPRIYFAKAFAYPVAAAPFVWLFGTRGLLLTNALALGFALVVGYGEARRRAGPLAALALTLVIFLGGVTPVYLVWLQPEVFNLALVTASIVAWRRDRVVLAALILGLATYSKPTHVLLALPLLLSPLLARHGASLVAGIREALRRCLVLVLTAASLYGVNAAVTGELNYQGGERKTFYQKFPLETPGVTFGNSGFWMTTERLGPPVEGKDDGPRRRGEAAPLAPEVLRAAFVRNIGYFWIGRYAGAAVYFAPVVLSALLFLLRGPRTMEGWLALGSLLISFLVFIWYIPDNWYGGGGALGNRYFLSLVPLAMLLVPRGWESVVATAGTAWALVFLVPVLSSPVAHSLHPGDHATSGRFRLFPIELTMLNDLSFNAEPWRRRQPFGDTEGDPHKGWPSDPKAYWLYFPDDGTFGKEIVGGAEGFWLRGATNAEVILRANEPVLRMSFRLKAGPAGDTVTIRVGGHSQTVLLRPEAEAEATLQPGPGFNYYDSFLHVITLESRFGAAPPAETSRDTRVLGTFVRLLLDVEKRPR